MRKGLFKNEAANENHKHWKKLIKRLRSLYSRPKDIRSEFIRDYNRILHCTAYRRLKHKTQVFFAPKNDHICTRIEHVNHVTSVSYIIAKFMGLNTELATAIALGHDLGHAPFGHPGEDILKEITQKELGFEFWHEKNSLRFVDYLETLKDPEGFEQNLNLTYAVRDGIVCHCGEVDQKTIKPRKEFIDLEEIEKATHPDPITWEGCVVKIADKIAYLGRDMEDAITLEILSEDQVKELEDIVKPYIDFGGSTLNTTVIMHEFIIDLCENSNPDDGLKLSDEKYELMKKIKDFNYNNIYLHPRIKEYKEYARLIINTIYNKLKENYEGKNILKKVEKMKNYYPILGKVFSEWLRKYMKSNDRPQKYRNKPLYDLENEKDYSQCIVDFISGMTDMFAIQVFGELTSFL